MDIRGVISRSLAAAEEGDYRRAITDLEKHIEHADHDGRLSDALLLIRNAAIIAQRFGSSDEAIRLFEMYLQRNERDPSVHLVLADLFRQVGDVGDAQSHELRCAELAVELADETVLEILRQRSRQNPSGP